MKLSSPNRFLIFIMHSLISLFTALSIVIPQQIYMIPPYFLYMYIMYIHILKTVKQNLSAISIVPFSFQISKNQESLTNYVQVGTVFF